MCRGRGPDRCAPPANGKRLRSIALIGCLYALLLPSNVLAEAPVPHGDLTVIDAEGRRWSGLLRSLTPERLVLAGEATNELRPAELRLAEFSGRRAAPFERGAAVLLANGDRLVAEPVRMDDANLTVRWTNLPGEPEVEIPLETVRGVMLSVPETSGPRIRLLTTVLEHGDNSDLLLLDNGDRLSGELTAMDETSVSLDGPVGETKVSRGGVRAIGLNPELISFPGTDGPRVLLMLTNGSIITARDLQLQSKDRLELEAAFGPRLDVPLSAVVSLRFEGERIVPLSSLEPASYEFTPYVGGHWELRRDRSVSGGPLQVRGVEYPRGLGMHSRSRVSYNLGGQYRSFQAIAGIDDATAGEGSAVFAIEVDGRRVFTSPAVSGVDEPLKIPPIDLTGAQRLTLIVDYGAHADIQDRADWCDPVLVR